MGTTAERISNYFFDLVDKEMDQLWESGEWNEQTLEELKTAHYRTPYKSFPRSMSKQ